jgi:hypothetical protein
MESGFSKRCILHCKQNLGRAFAPKVTGKAEKVIPVVNDDLADTAAQADDADPTVSSLAFSPLSEGVVPMNSLGPDETVRRFYPPFL